MHKAEILPSSYAKAVQAIKTWLISARLMMKDMKKELSTRCEVNPFWIAVYN